MKDARGAATATADELIQPVLATKHVVGALQHLQKQLEKDQTPLFVREELAQELLQKLIVTSFSEEDALCECLLRGCGQFVAVSAAVRTLKEIQKADDNSFGAFDLSLVVLRRSLCTRVKDAAQVKQPVGVSADDWVNLLLRLPSIIANACHTLDTSFPSWATQGKYYPRLVDCALGMIMLTDDATAYCRSLVQHMLRRGGEEVTLGMYHAYERASARNHSREKVSCAIRTILRSLVPREFAVVSRSMILYALSAEDKVDENVRFSNEWLDSILRTVLASDRGHCDAFVRSMVLSSQTKDWKLCYITASLLAGAPPPENGDDIAAATASSDDDSDSEDSQTGYEKHPPEDRLLRRYLSEISVQWSEARFVRQTDAKQQRNVSIFLRVGMNLLIGPMEDAASSLVAVLLEGVTERLSSSTRSIRIDGMRVAELLAKRLGEEVHFDELEEEEEHAKETDKVFAKTGSLINKNKKGHTKKHFILKETDPDALYVSDEEDSDGNEKSDSYNDDSTWDEESVLEPYDLHDDEEDIRETPRPLYLADCLDLLRIPESNEHAASSHETALNEVTQLVRSRPMDLPDLGALLAFELLRLEDKFNTSGFSELVSESLCALAVEEPFSVGEMLIKELFQDMGLADRLTALDTLANAAIELSGSHELLELRKGSQGERYVKGQRPDRLFACFATLSP